MAQLRIKRSTGSSAPSSTDLANAELAFAEGNDILYYGEGTSGSNAASVIKIGGSGAFCDLTTAQTVAGNKTFSNNVVVTGNLTVNGTTTTVATTNTTVSDNILELNSGAGSNANDCGILIERGSTGSNAFIGWDESADQFILGTTTATADSTGNLTVSAGTIQGNVTGSAVSLANTRSIALTGDVTGSANFNGTANASIAATIASSSIERGMLDLVSTSSAPGLTVKGDGTTDGYLQLNCSQNSHGVKIKSPAHSAGASYTLTLPTSDGSANQILQTDGSGVLSWTSQGAGGDVNQNAFSNVAVSGQTTVAADSATDTLTLAGAGGLALTTNATSDTVTFTIGTLNQDTTGSAATLTTARNIAGVSFDGSANISLNNNAITNGAGYITSSGSISGNAATATTATTATNVTATANNSTNETVYLTFVDGATGGQGIETDTGLAYNPSTGLLTVGSIDGGTY